MFRFLRHKILLYIIIPLGDLLFHTKVLHYYRQIKRMYTWSPEQIEKWQISKLKELIQHFYNNTSYYKNVLDELKIKPSDINSIEDLKKIPPINKSIALKNAAKLVPGNIKNIQHKHAQTGGSTGEPFKYLLDLRSWSYTTAIKIFSWEHTSYLYGDNYATIGSSSLFPTNKKSLKHTLYYKLKRSLNLNAMNMSDTIIEGCIQQLRKNKIRFLFGYASALFLIAKYVNRNNIILPKIKGCFSTSEILTPDYKKEIIKAFGFVMDCYGARDGGVTAYEINPNQYHVGYNTLVYTANNYAENTGNLMVTDLLSYSFPFINYEIGDDVEMMGKSKIHNFNGQCFSQVMGRDLDIIHLDNGNNLTGVGFSVMFGFFKVYGYRITKVNGLKIKIEIQPRKEFTKEDEKQIIDTFNKYAGDDCAIELVYVDNFKPGKNGKRNFFLNS